CQEAADEASLCSCCNRPAPITRDCRAGGANASAGSFMDCAGPRGVEAQSVIESTRACGRWPQDLRAALRAVPWRGRAGNQPRTQSIVSTRTGAVGWRPVLEDQQRRYASRDADIQLFACTSTLAAGVALAFSRAGTMQALTHPCLVRSGWTGGTSAVEPAPPRRSGWSLPWRCNVAIRLNKITVSDPGRLGDVSQSLRSSNSTACNSLIPKRRDVRVVEGARLESEAGQRHRATPTHPDAQSIRRLPAPRCSQCDAVNGGVRWGVQPRLTQFLHIPQFHLRRYIVEFAANRSRRRAEA